MSLSKRHRKFWPLLMGIFLLMGLAGPLLGLVAPHLARAQSPHALIVTINGTINPVKERFISRAIEQAVEDQATLLILELDTPWRPSQFHPKDCRIIAGVPAAGGSFRFPQGR